MPDFTIKGNPGGIRSRAATTRSKAESFSSTGDALATITTDGWNSRAGDRFREKFDTEPERWRASGDGFVTAANALENYADALDHAQSRARSAEREYARGDQVSQDAKGGVRRGRLPRPGQGARRGRGRPGHDADHHPVPRPGRSDP